MPTKLRQLLMNLGLTLLSIVFLIVAIEFLFHVFPAVIPDSFLTLIPRASGLVPVLTPRQQAKVNWYLSPAVVNDPTYGFRISYRNTNGYDENGFRNRENYSAVDVVALGDSFVQGAGAPDEKTWLHLIEDTYHVKILSLGVGGWSTFQEERAYAEFGRGRQAKVTILAFYYNDIGEIEVHEDWAQSNLKWTEYVLRRTESSSSSIKYFIRNNSFIGIFLWEAVTRSYARLQSRREWAMSCPANVNPSTPGEFNEGEVGLLLGNQPDRIALLPARPGFQLVVEAIRRTALISREDGSRFIVLYIPFREQVYRPMMARLPPDKVRKLDSLATELAKASEEAGIEFYDMTEDFRREANQCVWLYAADGHWNEAGNALAARLLWARIAERIGK